MSILVPVLNLEESVRAEVSSVEPQGEGHREEGDDVTTRDFQDLMTKLPRYLIKCRSNNTNKKYLGYFKRWKNFMLARNRTYVPAEPIHVALFIVHLLENKVSNSCIESYVYSIKWAHQLRGLSDPTVHSYVKCLLETSKRCNTLPKVKKECVSASDIKGLFELYKDSKDPIVVRDLAMIILCFSVFLRYDEVSHLCCKDILFHEDHVQIKITQSKTDQYRKGDTIVLSKLVSTTCPYKMLKEYIQINNIDLSSSQFLFKPMFRSKKKCGLIKKNKRLSYTRTRETITKKLKQVVGVQRNIGLHSLRAGGATAAANSQDVSERCWK